MRTKNKNVKSRKSNKKKSLRLTIELDQEDAYIVAGALELVGRVCMGQIDRIADYMPECAVGEDWKNKHQMSDKLRLLSGEFTGLGDWRTHYGIASREINPNGARSYEIERAIRKVLFHHENGPGGSFMCVDGDPLMSITQKPLPKIEVVSS